MTTLGAIFERLHAHFGALTGPEARRPWWPLYGDDPPFEMLVGAVLVQQTRWETVEAAVLRMLRAGLLAPPALAAADPADLAAMIRPAAFHTQKAPGLVAIARHISERHGGSTAAMLARPAAEVRAELLALPRVGRETCDVTMLYGGGHAVFVVDEYTRRLFERVGPEMQRAKGKRQKAEPWRAPYDQLRLAIEGELELQPSRSPALPRPAPHAPAPGPTHELYAEFHAQINEACVRYCLARPRCDGPPARRVYSRQEGRESYLDLATGCPLRPICGYYRGERGERG